MVGEVQLWNAYALLTEDMGDDGLPFSAIAPEAREYVESAPGDIEHLLHLRFSADERALVKSLLSRGARYEQALAAFAVGRALAESTAESFWWARAQAIVLNIIETAWRREVNGFDE
jgi:hypothetical protein